MAGRSANLPRRHLVEGDAIISQVRLRVGLPELVVTLEVSIESSTEFAARLCRLESEPAKSLSVSHSTAPVHLYRGSEPRSRTLDSLLLPR